jgi:putative peptidoglycan lipid II flippase
MRSARFVLIVWICIAGAFVGGFLFAETSGLLGRTTVTPTTAVALSLVGGLIGTTLGIVAQALVLVPSLRRSGFHWGWRLDLHDSRLSTAGTLTLWVIGYVVVSQIGYVVVTRLANEVSTAGRGYAVFTNASLLFQMPYGVLGVSLLTALMPRMSRAAARGDRARVVADLSLGSRLSALTLVPVTAAFIVLGPAIGTVIYAHGHTTTDAARQVGVVLAASAFGLVPFAITMLQLRVFYAMRDGRTPTLINAFMVGTKIILVLVTNDVFAAPAGTNVNKHPSVHAVEWLNISTSLSYVVGAIVGHVLLTRRLGLLGFRRVGQTVTQIAIASAIGAAAAWAVVSAARHAFGSAHLGSGVGLLGGSVVGLLVLVGVLWRMRIDDVHEVVALARRR